MASGRIINMPWNMWVDAYTVKSVEFRATTLSKDHYQGNLSDITYTRTTTQFITTIAKAPEPHPGISWNSIIVGGAIVLITHDGKRYAIASSDSQEGVYDSALVATLTRRIIPYDTGIRIDATATVSGSPSAYVTIRYVNGIFGVNYPSAYRKDATDHQTGPHAVSGENLEITNSVWQGMSAPISLEIKINNVFNTWLNQNIPFTTSQAF